MKREFQQSWNVNALGFHPDPDVIKPFSYSNQLSMKEALAIRRIFSLVDMITKAKFSNSPNDLKIRLFG